MAQSRLKKVRQPGFQQYDSGYDSDSMDISPKKGMKHLPIDDEESYRDGPAKGYENSRSIGILGFQSGAVVGDSKAPVDFGFLFGQQPTPPKASSCMESTNPSSCSSPIRALTPDPSAETDDTMDEATHRRCSKKRALTMPMNIDWAQDLNTLKKAKLTAPRPPRKPHQVVFGHVEGEDRGENCMKPAMTRTDVFFWMRDDARENEEVLNLLREEDAYAVQETASLAPLREVLHEEMRLHMKETDKGIPTPHPGDYAYYSSSFAGKDYNKHFRVRIAHDGTPAGNEEFLLDENELSVDSDGNKRPFCSVCAIEPSPNHRILSYATDFEGNESYTIHFKDTPLPGVANDLDVTLRAPQESIENTTGDVCWSPEADRFYYVTLDSERRSEKVKVHRLGHPVVNDEVVFEEPDKRFWVALSKTACGRFLIISSCSSETSEHLLLDFQATSSSSLQSFAQRDFSHRYSLDYRGGYFYILTNKDGAKDSKLCRVAEKNLHLGISAWEDVWVPGQGTCVESHLCFESFIAISGREKGQSCIFIYEYDLENPLHVVTFPSMVAHSGFLATSKGQVSASTAYSASIEGSNKIFTADKLRCSYCSFTNPGCTYEYHVKSRTFKLLKAEEVPGFDERNYQSDLIMSHRRGVPISLVYHKGIHSEGLCGGPFPLLLTGYGAYGCCSDADFDGNRLSLLDRGVVYAVAHIRGGGELGRAWYEQGRYKEVKNRFQDFIDVAETLVSFGITESSKLTAWGTSSGGLLVGASVNLRPDLFRAVLMEVPFVDVLNTMCDPSIPLTVGEWEEIGNPNQRDFFYYMSEYSAYDNLRMQDYPAFMVTAALNDSMVGYWEPLKYISKLRLMKTDNKPTLLKVNFHGGHGGVSSRYESIKEYAFHFAFLLNQMGLGEACLRA